MRLAELPDGVRGYEDVKMRTVESYHQSLAELRAQLDEIPRLHTCSERQANHGNATSSCSGPQYHLGLRAIRMAAVIHPSGLSHPGTVRAIADESRGA